MNYTIRHIFSSEVDPGARALIRHNFKPEIMYDDLTKRAMKTTTGKGRRWLPAASELTGFDFYVAGFPCQSWSSAGQGLGAMDMRNGGRGMLWMHMFRFISIAKPKCVILENVPRLMQGNNHKYHKEMFIVKIVF